MANNQMHKTRLTRSHKKVMGITMSDRMLIYFCRFWSYYDETIILTGNSLGTVAGIFRWYWRVATATRQAKRTSGKLVLARALFLSQENTVVAAQQLRVYFIRLRNRE